MRKRIALFMVFGSAALPLSAAAGRPFPRWRALLSGTRTPGPAPAVGPGGIVAEPEELDLSGKRLKGTAGHRRQADADATVDLSSRFSKQWTGGEKVVSGGDVMDLSITFDANEDAYLSVLAPQWEFPKFYRFEFGMAGGWELPGGKYSVKLDVSIFRSRTANYINLRKEGQDEPVYRKRIRHLLAVANKSGHPVTVGGRVYRLFFDYDIDGSKSPAEVRKNVFGVVLVYDDGDEDEHDFTHYVVPFADLKTDQVVVYELFDGQRVGLLLLKDKTTLEFYDLNKEETS